MAYKISDFSGTVIAPSLTYPQGDVKDAPSGTVVNKRMVTDIVQFFQKMAAEGGITLNSLPDNAANGYQMMEAVTDTINSYAATWVLNSIGADYDNTKTYVIYGCETATTNGYVFHDGKVYYCAGRAGPICGGGLVDTLQMTSPLSYTNGLQTLNILCGASGSGVADFSALIYINKWKDMGLTASDVYATSGGTVDATSATFFGKYMITGNTVQVQVYIDGMTITGTPAQIRVAMNFLPTAPVTPTISWRSTGVYYEGGTPKEPMFVSGALSSSGYPISLKSYTGFTAGSSNRGIGFEATFEINSI